MPTVAGPNSSLHKVRENKASQRAVESLLVILGAVGMLAAFSILGAMSVGFFYLPVTLLIGAAALSYDVRNTQPIVAHLGVCLLSGVAQVALMLALIRLL